MTAILNSKYSEIVLSVAINLKTLIIFANFIILYNLGSLDNLMSWTSAILLEEFEL
jgi:hypothetical protein